MGSRRDIKSNQPPHEIDKNGYEALNISIFTSRGCRKSPELPTLLGDAGCSPVTRYMNAMKRYFKSHSA